MYFDEMAAFIEDHAAENERPLPLRPALVQLLEVVFFFSLTREEGVPVRCALLIIDPANPDPKPPLQPSERRWRCVPLEEPILVTVAALAKIALAADPWSTALAVHHDGESWFVWG